MQHQHRPAPPLAALVDSIWFAARPALAHDRELALPTGRADIVIPLLQDSIVRFDGIDAANPSHLRGAIVSGAHDRVVVRGVAGASAVIGVHFRPGGAARLLGGALRELRNRTVLLEALWGSAASELREQLQAAPSVAVMMGIVEDALLRRLTDAPARDTMVASAVQAIGSDPSFARIGAVQRSSGCLPPAFIRRFEAAVGMTPKRYANIARFNLLLSRVHAAGDSPIDWAGLAFDGGYSDQPHLTREFGRLAGMTPGTYARSRARWPTHVPLDEPLRTTLMERIKRQDARRDLA